MNKRRMARTMVNGSENRLKEFVNLILVFPNLQTIALFGNIIRAILFTDWDRRKCQGSRRP